MSAQIIYLTAVREERYIERFYELMVGDLDAPDVAILETLDDADLEMFFRLRKRVKQRIADNVVETSRAVLKAQLKASLDIDNR